MKTDNPHTGHRKRLRSLIDKVGLEKLTDVQIVEQILTMSHARKDTNEIAHALLSKFGSISKILDADYKSLVAVEGVGEVTAKLITYLPQIFDIYVKDKTARQYNCKNFGDVYKYFEMIFAGKTKEVFVVAYVNKNNTFQNFEIIAQGDTTSVKLDKAEINKSLVYNNATSLITAHNHPFGSASPSTADYDCYYSLKSFFLTLGIAYLDNVIIGDDGMFTFKQNMFIDKKDLIDKN